MHFRKYNIRLFSGLLEVVNVSVLYSKGIFFKCQGKAFCLGRDTKCSVCSPVRASESWSHGYFLPSKTSAHNH